jgi:glutaredoxin
MQYQLYKPNSQNTGCAASFQIGKNKDGSPCLFINAIMQSGWNDQTKTGSFKENAKNPQKSTVVKMNHNEAGEMISSLKTRHPVVFFHKNNSDQTIITFSPWDKDRKVKTQAGESIYKSPAFGLSISKNSSLRFKVALEAGETEVLALILADFINQCLFHEGNKFQSNDSSTSSSDNGDAFLDSSSNSPQANKPTLQTNPIDDSDDVPF